MIYLVMHLFTVFITPNFHVNRQFKLALDAVPLVPIQNQCLISNFYPWWQYIVNCHRLHCESHLIIIYFQLNQKWIKNLDFFSLFVQLHHCAQYQNKFHQIIKCRCLALTFFSLIAIWNLDPTSSLNVANHLPHHHAIASE